MATLLPAKTLNLCVDCAYYSASAAREGDDTCLRPEATTGGVRVQSQKTCMLMRLNECMDGKLFTAKG